MTEPQRIIVRAVVTETGDLHLCNTGLSLLFGVPEEAIMPGIEHPKSWEQAAVRRIQEAEAHGSGSGLGAVLAYWTDVERDGVELVLLEQDDRGGA